VKIEIGMKCAGCGEAEATLSQGMVLYGGHVFPLCSDCHGILLERFGLMRSGQEVTDGENS
jgi:hypothetical protein